jgi:hypothetical protein
LQTTLLSADFISFIPGATHDTFPVSLRPFPGREAEESGGKLGRTQASARNGGGPPPVIAFANITVPQLPKNGIHAHFQFVIGEKLIDGAAEAKPGRRRFDILNLSSDPNHMVANRDARRTSRPTR